MKNLETTSPSFKGNTPTKCWIVQKNLFVDTFLTNSLDLFDCNTLVEEIYDAEDRNVSEKWSDEFSLFEVLGMIIGSAETFVVYVTLYNMKY